MPEIDPLFTRRVGSTVGGKYRLERVLGVGGMGAVYEATNTWTERRVALKLLLGDATSREGAVERFFREARASTRVGHPNVVEVLDMGQDAEDKSFFLVMELLSGSTLRSLLHKRRKLPYREAFALLVPVLGALHATHLRGIVHRDLKPENLFLARDADGTLTPKLIDFGVARIEDTATGKTRTGAVLGTPAYMSPEQAGGERDVDAQTDVWAVGAVLFECLTGRLPFEGSNVNQILAAILMKEPPSFLERVPSLPAPLAQALQRCLQRDRAARYPSMKALLLALRECFAADSTPEGRALLEAFAAALDPPAAPPDTDWEALSAEATLPAEHQRALEEAATAPPTSLVPSLESQLSVAPQVTAPPPRARSVQTLRVGLVSAALLGALGLGALWRASQRPLPVSAPAPAPNPPPRAAPEHFRVEVRVEPASAQLLFDGAPVEGNVLVRSLPRDGRSHVLRASAEGYATQAISFVDSAPSSPLVLPRVADAAAPALVLPGPRDPLGAPRAPLLPERPGTWVRQSRPTRQPTFERVGLEDL